MSNEVEKLKAVADAAGRVIDSWFNGNEDCDLDGNMRDMAEAHAKLEEEDGYWS